MKQIIPAILTKDIAYLQNKLLQIQGFSDWVQIDIMDGIFVDNTSVTLEDVFSLQIVKDFSLEIHLMVKNPVTYFLACQNNNVKRVVFHAEAGNIEDVLKEAETNYSCLVGKVKDTVINEVKNQSH